MKSQYTVCSTLCISFKLHIQHSLFGQATVHHLSTARMIYLVCTAAACRAYLSSAAVLCKWAPQFVSCNHVQLTGPEPVQLHWVPRHGYWTFQMQMQYVHKWLRLTLTLLVLAMLCDDHDSVYQATMPCDPPPSAYACHHIHHPARCTT